MKKLGFGLMRLPLLDKNDNGSIDIELTKKMVDTFMEAGNGYRYTFNGFFRLLPIDYILTSENIEVVSSEVDYSVTLSDHYPIVARLNLKNKK